MNKKLVVALIFVLNFLCCAESNLLLFKEQLKAQLVNTSLQTVQNGAEGILIADRLEADAFLELVGRDYKVYGDTYKDAKNIRLSKPKEAVIMMPQIDLLAENLERLGENVDVAYVFVMEGDKLDDEVYGDRSYETYKNSELDRMLPSNVKVLRLYNQSVSREKGQNKFELNVPILETVVFWEQVFPIYMQISKDKTLGRVLGY